MIKVNKNILIESGFKLPLSWAWDIQGCTNCLSILPAAAGVVEQGDPEVLPNGKISLPFELQFSSETCIDECTLTFDAEDANGCEMTLNVPITNPCEDLQFDGGNCGGITHTYPFNFHANVSGGGGTYTYIWDWHDVSEGGCFELVDGTGTDDNILNLQLADGCTPASGEPTTIYLTVVDTFNKCEISTQCNYNFCIPDTDPVVLTLFCDDETGDSYLNNIDLSGYVDASACGERVIDWSTLEFFPQGNAGLLTITQNGDTSFIDVFAPNGTAAGNYTITFTVEDNLGFEVEGTISITVNECEPATSIVSNCSNLRFDCDDIGALPTATTKCLDLSSCIFTVPPGGEIDWSTFDFYQGTGQTKVSATELTTAEGNTVTFTETSTELCYELSNTPTTNSETVSFKVCTTNPDNCSSAIEITFILDCQECPDLIDDTACTTCGQSVDIDVTDNDNDYGYGWDFSSLTITSSPTNGSVSINTTTGIITYTANVGYAGSDSFQYTISNNNPNTCNDSATVDVTVVCAGEGGEIDICE